MMTTGCIRSVSGFLALRDDWERLAGETRVANVFLEWDWIHSWWQWYGRESSPCVITGRDGAGKVIAIAPLHIRPRGVMGLRLRSVELIGSGEVTPDHLAFICPPGRMRDFSAAVFQRLAHISNEWDMIRLTDMDDDNAAEAGDRLCAGGEIPLSRSSRGVCPYISLPRSWEAYVAGRSAKVRRNIGAGERELARKFSVEYSFCRRQEDVPPMMRALEGIHRKRMRAKNLGPREQSMQDVFWRFQSDVAGLLVRKDRLFMGGLKLDGRMAACLYGFSSNWRVMIYQSGLDPEFNAYSPGFLLFCRLIREAISRGFTEFDFLRGDERYKFHFTDQVRHTMELTGWGRNARAAAARCLHLPVWAIKSAAGRIWKK